jgi:hypothetical protein
MRSARVELILDTLRAVKGAKDMSKATDGVAGSLAATAKEGARAGRVVDEVGEEMSDAARAAASFDREVEKLSGSLRELAIAQALTGGDFTKQIRQQETQLRRLSRNRNLLGDAAEPAAGFVARLTGRLGPMLASMPLSPHMAAVLGGAAAVAAPMIGATIAGAIIGGAGIGGVVGGTAVAFRDKRVQSAVDAFGNRIQDRLERAAGGFVGPTLQSIATIERALDTVDFDQIFGNSSRYLPMLTQGIASGIEDAGDGFERLVLKAEPVMDVIGNGFANLGDAIGDVFTDLSDNGVDAAVALNQAFQAVEGTIRTVGMVVNGLTEAYGFLAKYGAFGRDAQLEYIRLEANAKLAADANRGAAGSLDRVKGAADATAPALRSTAQAYVSLEQAVAATVDKNLSAAESMIRQREAAEDAADAIDKKSRVTDKEASALIAMARATNSTTATLDEQGRTVGQATKAHEDNRKKLYETARAMGYSKAEAKKLASQYLAVPKGVSTPIEQPNMPKAQRQAKDYYKNLDRIQDKIRTNVSVVGDAVAYKKLERLLIAQQAAKKGISVSAAQSAFNKNARGFHAGGWTGPGPTMQEAGVVHADEYVIPKVSRRKIERSNPGLLDEMRSTGRVPGYARGGLVMPFPVNASMTKVISMEEALKKVTPAGPSGVSGPWMEQLLERRFGVDMISGFRRGSRTLSGNLSYHARNRAVDFPPMRAMARFMYENYKPRLKEAITPYQEYNVHNGSNRRWTGAVWRQHAFGYGNAHNHFAMAGGGVIREPVLGLGRSGATYSFAERGPERVMSTAQTMAGGRASGPASVTINAPITINGASMSPRQIAEDVSRRLGAQFNQLTRGVA